MAKVGRAPKPSRRQERAQMRQERQEARKASEMRSPEAGPPTSTVFSPEAMVCEPAHAQPLAERPANRLLPRSRHRGGRHKPICVQPSSPVKPPPAPPSPKKDEATFRDSTINALETLQCLHKRHSLVFSKMKVEEEFSRARKRQRRRQARKQQLSASSSLATLRSSSSTMAVDYNEPITPPTLPTTPRNKLPIPTTPCNISMATVLSALEEIATKAEDDPVLPATPVTAAPNISSQDTNHCPKTSQPKCAPQVPKKLLPMSPRPPLPAQQMLKTTAAKRSSFAAFGQDIEEVDLSDMQLYDEPVQRPWFTNFNRPVYSGVPVGFKIKDVPSVPVSSAVETAVIAARKNTNPPIRRIEDSRARLPPLRGPPMDSGSKVAGPTSNLTPPKRDTSLSGSTKPRRIPVRFPQRPLKCPSTQAFTPSPSRRRSLRMFHELFPSVDTSGPFVQVPLDELNNSSRVLPLRKSDLEGQEGGPIAASPSGVVSNLFGNMMKFVWKFAKDPKAESESV